MLQKHATRKVWFTFAALPLFGLLPILFATSQTAATMSQQTAGVQTTGTEFADFDPDNFDHPTTIDNEWLPLKPGTQFIYEGFTVEDGEEIPHQIVFTVTDLTKVIGGVRTVVIFDRDYSDGELEESELTFFAQDNDGNVWHLGQYSETYDEEGFVGGQAFLVGHLEGVKAGIMMKAEPKLGTPSYSQGFAPPPFNFTDRARVFKTGQETSVPFGDFEDVLVIEEFDQEEPDAFQLKYYAASVGNVRVGWRGADESQETLELVDVVQLGEDALSEVRAEALELETRANVYGSTPPAEHNDDKERN
jgi:hypothetical protein